MVQVLAIQKPCQAKDNHIVFKLIFLNEGQELPQNTNDANDMVLQVEVVEDMLRFLGFC